MTSTIRLTGFVALCLAGQALAWQLHLKPGGFSAGRLASQDDTSHGAHRGGNTRQDDFTSGQAFLRRRLQQDSEEQLTGLAAWNPRTHGYVATISMGLAAPLAVVIARNFREFAPAWIWIHAPLALAAFIGGIVGVVFGSKLPEDGLDDTVYSAHKALGGIALALFGINILGGLARPKPAHKLRRVFNVVHHWAGRLALVFAIITVYLGLHLADELYKFWWGYAIALGAIILLWLVKELIDFFAVLSSNRRGTDSKKPAGPVNGSFASVFLLKNRPQPGEPAYDGKTVPDGAAVSDINGNGCAKHATNCDAGVNGTAANGFTAEQQPLSPGRAGGIEMSQV